MCARHFFVFKVTVSPAENNSRDTFLKTLSKNRGMPSIKVEIYQDMNVTHLKFFKLKRVFSAPLLTMHTRDNLNFIT